MDKINEVVAKANIENALHLIAEASQQAPLDTGLLRSSGDYIISDDGLSMSVIFSAKGEDGEDYAAEQHEDLTYNHENGKAKYLEDPFNENLNKYIDNIINKIAEVL